MDPVQQICFIIPPFSSSRQSTQCNDYDSSSATADRGSVFLALWKSSMTARWCYRQKSFLCGGNYIWRVCWCWSYWVITHWMFQTIPTTNPMLSLQAVKSRAGELLGDMMHSGPMKVAMIVSAIVFTQTSILNFSYFLNNIIRILQYDLKIGNFL